MGRLVGCYIGCYCGFMFVGFGYCAIFWSLFAGGLGAASLWACFTCVDFVLCA